MLPTMMMRMMMMMMARGWMRTLKMWKQTVKTSKTTKETVDMYDAHIHMSSLCPWRQENERRRETLPETWRNALKYAERSFNSLTLHRHRRRQLKVSFGFVNGKKKKKLLMAKTKNSIKINFRFNAWNISNRTKTFAKKKWIYNLLNVKQTKASCKLSIEQRNAL